MKLFKGHAVMPRTRDEATHAVRTYVVIGEGWQDARKRIGAREPGAHFVTVPTEILDPLMVDTRSIDAREFADLRSACVWNEALQRTRME
jgi:hypothetical protein